MNYPLWATPERRAFLMELGQHSCTYRENPCPVLWKFAQAIVDRIGPPQPDANPLIWVFRAALHTPAVMATMSSTELHHLPPWLEKELIAYWKAVDRDARSYLWKLEKRRLHRLPKIKRRGQFDSIKREQYLADRPIFRIVAIGVDAFTHRRVVKVELPGLGEALWIPFTGLKARKSKLRKLARYGGKIPADLVEPLEKVVSRAVAEYLKNSPQG